MAQARIPFLSGQRLLAAVRLLATGPIGDDRRSHLTGRAPSGPGGRVSVSVLQRVAGSDPHDVLHPMNGHASS